MATATIAKPPTVAVDDTAALETYAERYKLPRTLVQQYPSVAVLLRDKLNADYYIQWLRKHGDPASIQSLQRENAQLKKEREEWLPLQQLWLQLMEKSQNVRPNGNGNISRSSAGLR